MNNGVYCVEHKKVMLDGTCKECDMDNSLVREQRVSDMPIKLKDVKGLMVDKYHVMPELIKCDVLSARECHREGFNQGLNCISERQIDIVIDRERLASVIWKNERADGLPEHEKVMVMEQCYRYADLIITQKSNLVKIVYVKE